MKKLKVLFVEDEADDDFRRVMDELAGTGLVEVAHEADYDSLGDSTRKIRKAVDRFDLLVLDVLMVKDSRPFVGFVNAVAGVKPFIAYTLLNANRGDVETVNGPVELRKFVFEKGGLGVITKAYIKHYSAVRPVADDIVYELMEKILWFYWTSGADFRG